jgi:sugar-specific transcriptional regulator TrmB
MVEKELWSRLGFSDGEGRVYESILNSEAATLQSVHEHTGIERRNVYDIINKLISKGLVAYYSENKHKIYRITHPNKILSYLEDEEKAVSEKKALLARELPSLIKKHESAKPAFDVRIFRGKEGIKALFNEMLGFSDHYYIGGNWGMVKYVGKEWVDRWMEKRVKKKIWMHDILAPDVELLASYPLPTEYYEFRILPPEFGSPNVILIYGNRVANIFWGENLFAFQIENADIAKNYVTYFNYLWKTLDGVAKVYYGFDGMVAAHENTYLRLKPGEEYYYLGIPQYQSPQLHAYWKKDHARRAKAGIIGRLLFNTGTDRKILENRNSYVGSDARYMPSDLQTPAWFFGYKDVTVIGLPSKNPISIEITNPAIAASFRAYFEDIWARSKPFK